jgi:hypothetical protein
MVNCRGVFLCCVLGSGCSSIPSAPAESVSPSAIRSNPDAYIGKSVVVRGFLTDEFENRALWDSPSAAKHLTQSQCLALVSSDDRAPRRVNRYTVAVRGVVMDLRKSVVLNACIGVGVALSGPPTRARFAK